MTRMVRITVAPLSEWSTIEVPVGATFVWALPTSRGGIGVPPRKDAIGMYWSVKNSVTGEEEPAAGTEPWLIRVGNEPDSGFPGNPNPYPFPTSVSGLPNAVPFVSDDLFIWVKKKGLFDPDFPVNKFPDRNPS
ncbi:hypothetical protein [Nocardia sp. IFM 10818]